MPFNLKSICSLGNEISIHVVSYILNNNFSSSLSAFLCFIVAQITFFNEFFILIDVFLFWFFFYYYQVISNNQSILLCPSLMILYPGSFSIIYLFTFLNKIVILLIKNKGSDICFQVFISNLYIYLVNFCLYIFCHVMVAILMEMEGSKS